MYQYGKCLKAESVLKKLKIKFSRGTFSQQEVNWKVTEENCGRLGTPVSDATVEDYADGFKRGDTFPAPIIVKTPVGILVVAGVHRVKGANVAGIDEMEGAYVAEIELPHFFRLVATMTNRLEGRRINRDEALAYAVDLCESKSLMPTEVADFLGVNHQTLNGKLRARELKKQAAEIGCKSAGRTTDAVAKAFARLAPNSKVLSAAFDHASRFAMTESEARELAQQVAKEKTEAQQLSLLEKRSEEKTQERSSPSVLTLAVRTKFIRTVHSIKSIIEGKKALTDLQIVRGSDEAKKLFEEWQEINSAIVSIFAGRSSGRLGKTGTSND